MLSSSCWSFVFVFLLYTACSCGTGGGGGVLVNADIHLKFQERHRCDHAHNKVQKRHLVQLHYNASIDASSEVGRVGQPVANTRSSDSGNGEPVSIIVGVGQTGWDSALQYLCVGDKVDLIVRSPEAPYGVVLAENKDDFNAIPKGATVRLTIQIVSTQPPQTQLHDHDAFLFSQADTNHDDKLSVREFLFYFKDKSARIGSKQYRRVLKELEALFQQLDKNRDKVIVLEEFVFHKASVHAHTGLNPRDSFDFYDDDNDGRLNAREIEGFFRAIQSPVVPIDYWKHVDQNQNGYISFEEFTKGAYHKYYSSEL